MGRARMTVAYRGDAFRGFAPSDGVPTVAGAIAGAIKQVLGEDVSLVAAGRTDAGVHATGQVVSMDLPDRVDPAVLARQINALCGPSIVVRDARWAPAEFHARYSALWRSYRYQVLNSPVPDPFLADRAWHIHRPLNIRAMRLAVDAIVGEHDFSAFCRRPKDEDGREPSMKRYVMDADWVRSEDGLTTFRITANAFCHQMVRALVGTFVEVGLGKRPPSDVRGLLVSGDRSQAAQVAPPHGLVLVEVGYPLDLG
jgi:tRNA pseudouridine38-40 synthase